MAGSRRDHFYEVVNGALDQVEWLDADRARAVIDGEPVMVEAMLLRSSGAGAVGSTLTLEGLYVDFDLGDREIMLGIDDRARTVPSLPEVRSGDPAFDERYLIQGWPAEVGGAFDDPIRRWVVDNWPSGWPSIRAEGGTLRVGELLFDSGGNQTRTVPHVAASLRHAQTLHHGLASTYDQARAAAVATGGEAGGLAWDDQLQGLKADRRRTRRFVRAGVFIFIALVFAAIAANTLAVAGVF